jgi:hypothetical protein
MIRADRARMFYLVSGSIARDENACARADLFGS